MKNVLNAMNNVVALYTEKEEVKKSWRKFNRKHHLHYNKKYPMMIISTACENFDNQSDRNKFYKKIFETNKNNVSFISNILTYMDDNSYYDELRKYFSADQYIETIMKTDRKLMYKILFENCYQILMNTLYDIKLGHKSREYFEVNKSFAALSSCLSKLADEYLEEMFKYSHRNSNKIFMFFYFFQEYFTDEMYEAFMKYMKKYKYMGSTNYYLKNATRRFSAKYFAQLQEILG